MDKVETDERNPGIIVDTLFLGPTRPTMILGVTYVAFILNMIFSVEAFIITRNLLWLAVCLPIHGVFVLICWNDPRTFDLIRLWCATKGWQYVMGFLGFGNFKYWQSASYGPLPARKKFKPKRKVLRKNKEYLDEVYSDNKEGIV
ncbi:TPA: type IV secretion system protein VirB3 [Klebsiella pneumoniae]|nr:type IV secretion system protein VirB3 [Klebsiella pneumoniae]